MDYGSHMEMLTSPENTHKQVLILGGGGGFEKKTNTPISVAAYTTMRRYLFLVNTKNLEDKFSLQVKFTAFLELL